MATQHDPASSPSCDAEVRPTEVDTEKKEPRMHARPLEPEPLPSKVKRVLSLLEAFLDL
jgi:hypothetical protein